MGFFVSGAGCLYRGMAAEAVRRERSSKLEQRLMLSAMNTTGMAVETTQTDAINRSADQFDLEASREMFASELRKLR